MNSVVFNASTESYQLSQITYAGYVSAIAEEKRRNGSTHSFRFMTRMGMVHSYYKTVEEARNARTALGAMLATAKPNVFKHGNEMIDPSHVVSFSLVVALKKPQNECTHAVVVTLDTVDQEHNKVWLRYKSEENAKKGRRALWSAVNGGSAQGASQENPATVTETEAVASKAATPAVKGDNLPF